MPKKSPQKAKARAKVKKKRQKATAEEERTTRKGHEEAMDAAIREPTRVA